MKMLWKVMRLSGVMALLGLGVQGSPVSAQTEPASSAPASPEASSEPGATKRPTRVRIDQGALVSPVQEPIVTTVLEALANDNPPGTPDKATVLATAQRLGVDPVALQLGVEGLGHVYAREYSQADAVFTKVTNQFPTSAVGPFGHVLLYQSWMLENYDFSKETQWAVASGIGLERAEAALDRGEAPAWNEFVRGALMGVDSIYQLRKGQYIGALSQAVKAISSIERSMELDPEFTDPALCMGVYNYWHSVLSEQYWFLPSFGDKRELGLSQIRMARDKGTFTGPGARLALAYSYLQERKITEAKDMCRDLASLYPNNLINNMLLGRIALRERRLRNARWYFSKVKEVSPENWLVEYYLGLLAMRERAYPAARDHFTEFLRHDGDVAGQAWAHYRLGDVYWQLYMDDAAKAQWGLALEKEATLSGPKRRLEGQTPHRGGTTQATPPRPGPSRNSGQPVDKKSYQVDEKKPPLPPEQSGE